MYLRCLVRWGFGRPIQSLLPQNPQNPWPTSAGTVLWVLGAFVSAFIGAAGALCLLYSPGYNCSLLHGLWLHISELAVSPDPDATLS